MKLHILKVTDQDDSQYEGYYTIKSLREQVLNEWYDVWGDNHLPHEQDYTKEQIQNSDEDLFSYMGSWGYNVEVVWIGTQDDFPKRTNVIEVDISFYHPDNDESVKVYDVEGMREEFEYELQHLLNN